MWCPVPGYPPVRQKSPAKEELPPLSGLTENDAEDSAAAQCGKQPACGRLQRLQGKPEIAAQSVQPTARSCSLLSGGGTSAARACAKSALTPCCALLGQRRRHIVAEAQRWGFFSRGWGQVQAAQGSCRRSANPSAGSFSRQWGRSRGGMLLLQPGRLASSPAAPGRAATQLARWLGDRPTAAAQRVLARAGQSDAAAERRLRALPASSIRLTTEELADHLQVDKVRLQAVAAGPAQWVAAACASRCDHAAGRRCAKLALSRSVRKHARPSRQALWLQLYLGQLIHDGVHQKVGVKLGLSGAVQLLAAAGRARRLTLLREPAGRSGVDKRLKAQLETRFRNTEVLKVEATEKQQKANMAVGLAPRLHMRTPQP